MTFVLAEGDPLVMARYKALKISVEYGADVDKACDDINHVTEKMPILAAERAADKAAKRAFLREQDAKKAEEAANA